MYKIDEWFVEIDEGKVEITEARSRKPGNLNLKSWLLAPKKTPFHTHFLNNSELNSKLGAISEVTLNQKRFINVDNYFNNRLRFKRLLRCRN